MGTQIPQPGQPEPNPETRPLITAADYFLQRRLFADCLKYAARARDSDPSHPFPTRLLSIASVLSVSMISATKHNYYAVLNLPNFEHDFPRIVSSFEALASILDPRGTLTNPCELQSEAYDLVMKAWSVLSNPIEKGKFDEELRCTLGSGGGTFWTMCPYCYCVYEYDRVYEDCCLRCVNEKCRRVLHAAAIAAAPPPDVVAKGEYWCPGFMPFGIRARNGGLTTMNLWNPFGIDGNVDRTRDYVVVSDDETIDVNRKANFGNQGHSNGGNVVEKAKRRKSVSGNSYELIGREARSNMANYDSEEEHQDVDSTLESLDEVEIGVDFFEGDDEIFLSLPCDLDLENAEKEAVSIK